MAVGAYVRVCALGFLVLPNDERSHCCEGASTELEIFGRKNFVSMFHRIVLNLREPSAVQNPEPRFVNSDH